jgi:DNA (cytosine-5)-methyltransferase 1
MRLLDLFCGAGGAAMGYSRAAFTDIVGVDITPQPHYPFTFVQADALEFVWSFGAGFDVIHASPPCQHYVRSGMVAKDGRHPDLVPATRAALHRAGKPYVIENVPGAPLCRALTLCGSMFGLGIRRHRLFESPALFSLQPSCNHALAITGVYGHPHGKGGAWRNGTRPMLPSNRETWSREMGINWMEPRELAQAIPPAYTEYIGALLLQQLREAA